MDGLKQTITVIRKPVWWRRWFLREKDYVQVYEGCVITGFEFEVGDDDQIIMTTHFTQA